jgi:SNF2 family DNA or RNA helicase
MVDFVTTHKRCALWAGMGIGKSSAQLFALDLLQLLGEIGNSPTLVVGPMRVARDTWPDEVSKWEQFQHLRIMPLTGTPKERLDKLKVKADIYTISYELLPWLVEHYLARWPFKQVVADESDRLKGFREKSHGTNLRSQKAGASGQRAHQIARVAHNLVDRWVNLTGTPSPNGLKDLWGQTWYLDRGKRLGTTYTAFKNRWFMPSWTGKGIVPQQHAQAQIHAALKDICLTIDPKDYFDLADPIVTPVIVKLPERARAIYKKLERDLFAELGDLGNVEVFNAAALTNKCLQLANGAVYTDYPTWAPIHDEKIEAVKSILAESGGTPLLVAYSFKSDLARLKHAFPKAVELSTKAGMAAFRAGDAAVGLAHPKSMGHGIDGLQLVTNILVRFGHDWNLGERMQMLERIGPMRQLQAGLDRNVFVYDIIAENTIDEDVVASHAAKRSVQDALLAAMKRSKQR